MISSRTGAFHFLLPASGAEMRRFLMRSEFEQRLVVSWWRECQMFDGDGLSHHPHHVRSFILRKDYSHEKDLAKRALFNPVLFRYFPTELLPPSDKQRDHDSLFP